MYIGYVSNLSDNLPSKVHVYKCAVAVYCLNRKYPII